MKESNWEDCIDFKFSIKITPDRAKAKSLIETSKGRIDYISKDPNEKNANYIFEDYYSSVLELIHALLILNGYKVSNHICLGYYLRDILKRDDLFRLFDDCRFKRNSLVYYGKRMDFETSIKTIEKSKKLFKEITLIINNIKDN